MSRLSDLQALRAILDDIKERAAEVGTELAAAMAATDTARVMQQVLEGVRDTAVDARREVVGVFEAGRVGVATTGEWNAEMDREADQNRGIEPPEGFFG